MTPKILRERKREVSIFFNHRWKLYGVLRKINKLTKSEQVRGWEIDVKLIFDWEKKI